MISLARRLLAALLPADVRQAVLTDLDAEYARAIRPSRGRLRGVAWYWGQCAGSIGPALRMRARRLLRLAADAGQDLRFAARLLGRQKAFAAAAVATLALGIGSTTAVFSLVDGVLLRPLPYRAPERLIRIWSANPRGIPRNQISPADFFDWRDQVRGLEGLAGFGWADVTLTSGGDPVRLTGASATANLADTLGVQPRLGRWFLAAETQGLGAPVAVLGERLWRERFAGSRDIIGRPVILDGRAHTVVGVMPQGFQFPTADHRVWLPLPDGVRAQTRSGRFLGAVARLGAGVTVDGARDALLTVARHLAATYPESDRGWGVTVAPLRDAVVGEIRIPLLVLLSAVAAVLLLASANVASLLVGRGVARSRELAVRAAVGATAGRLLRMQLVEALLLSIMGGVAGIGLAIWCVRAVQAERGLQMPLLDRVSVDGRVTAVALALSLACALVTGLWPAWKASRAQGGGALTAGARSTRDDVRIRHAIVFVQITVATTLVAAGALLINSLYRLTAVRPGFNAQRTLLADISLPGARYPRDTRSPFYTRVLDGVRAVPGVEAAGAGGPLPLSGLDGLLRFAVTIEGRTPAPGNLERAYLRWATPGYFQAMGIELRAGRVISASDTAGSTPVAVIDSELARRYFGTLNPIGRRLRTPLDSKTWREVVGVVAAVRQMSLDRDVEPHLYVPQAQLPTPDLTLVIRTTGDATAVAPAVRRIVRDLDAGLAVSNVRPLTEVVAGSAAPRRIGAWVLSLFAGAAVLLTLVGVYGVVSQVVAQSTKEIGVRLAMGATGRDVVSLVVLRALRVALAAVAAGSALAWVATPGLRSLLYGVGPRDPLTLACAAALLTGATAVAAYIPARRILRLDVINALRTD